MTIGLGQMPEPQGLGMPADPREAGKSSKADAQYVPQAPGAERCADCTMFQAPDQCTAVRGSISPAGVCKYFEPSEDA